jgi:hypothetical protein
MAAVIRPDHDTTPVLVLDLRMLHNVLAAQS